MKVKIGNADAATVKVDVLAISVFETESDAAGELKPAVARDMRALIAKSQFDGKAGSVLSLPSPNSVQAGRVLLLGLGHRGARPTTEAARRAAGRLSGRMSEHGATTAVLLPPEGSVAVSAASAEGLMLADYRFDRYKTGNTKKTQKKSTKTPQKTITLAVSDESRTALKAEFAVLEQVSQGTKLARDLGNEPSNTLTPTEMGKIAKALARKHAKSGMSCKVMSPAEIKKRGMLAFMAVAQGSDIEARFIHLVYKPKKAPRKARRIAIVGKGVTFDSGGISLKPGAGMQDMKMDMCGSATVLGLFECLPALGIKHEVHGFIAACDNMPSGKAYKPGDIIGSMGGKTIEVHNTDAEGRLTLVDALTEALKIKPDVIVDLATLTGAVVVALGACTGVMSRDQALSEALLAAADDTGERAWPLPLFEDYKAGLKSDFADIKNLGGRGAGSTTAGLFLDAWIPEGQSWAHLDIAGSAWVGKGEPYCPVGATGTGVRTLAQWLRKLA